MRHHIWRFFYLNKGLRDFNIFVRNLPQLLIKSKHLLCQEMRIRWFSLKKSYFVKYFSCYQSINASHATVSVLSYSITIIAPKHAVSFNSWVKPIGVKLMLLGMYVIAYFLPQLWSDGQIDLIFRSAWIKMMLVVFIFGFTVEFSLSVWISLVLC